MHLLENAKIIIRSTDIIPIECKSIGEMVFPYLLTAFGCLILSMVSLEWTLVRSFGSTMAVKK
jgi:hypothetical protein